MKGDKPNDRPRKKALRLIAGGAREPDGLQPAERLLLRLDKYKRTGDAKWMACCPAHLDNTPSLSIREVSEKDGRLLIHCFAGCTPEDVLTAVGLKFRDLFEETNDWQPPRYKSQIETPSFGLEDAKYTLEIITEVKRGDLELTEKGRIQAKAALELLFQHGHDVPVDIYEWVYQGKTGELVEPDAEQEWRIEIVATPDVSSSLSLPQWVVEGFIEQGSLNSIVGGWGSGKSLVQLDMMLRSTEGMPWQGIDLTSGIWVYVVGEAQRGFQRRISAWCGHNKVDSPSSRGRFIFEALPVGIPNVNDELLRALEELQQTTGEPIRGITLDTYAACFGLDDENSNSSVARYVNILRSYLIEPFGAAVNLLHHPGHGDKERGRGASALAGALDTEWMVKKDGNLISLSCTKHKDSEWPATKSWLVSGHTLHVEGQPVIAPVVTEVETSESAPVREGTKQAAMLACLDSLYAAARRNLLHAHRDPQGARITLDAWYQELLADGVLDNRKQFIRYQGELTKKNVIIVNKPHVYIPDLSNEPDF